MNKKITEALTTSIQIAPTVTTGISSSALLDMSKHERLIAKLICHRLPDAKGEGVVTVSLYESDVATWSASATAITVGVATATLNSVSDAYARVEIRAAQLTTNSSKRYVGAYCKPNTGTYATVIVERGAGSYNPQN